MKRKYSGGGKTGNGKSNEMARMSAAKLLSEYFNGAPLTVYKTIKCLLKYFLLLTDDMQQF